MSVVVDVLLRAALSERGRTDARTSLVGGERARDHLGGARRRAVHEGRDGAGPPVSIARDGRAIDLHRAVAPPHREERRAGEEERERAERPVGRPAAVAAKVEDHAGELPRPVRTLVGDEPREVVAEIVADVLHRDDERIPVTERDTLEREIARGSDRGLRLFDLADLELHDLPAAEDDGRERCLRVARSEAELVDLLERQPRGRDVRDGEHDIVDRERRRGGLRHSNADRGEDHAAPETRGRSRREIDLVDPGLFVERRPFAVRIDERNVGADRRGEDDARPSGLVERREETTARLVGVELPLPTERCLERARAPAELLGRLSRAPRRRDWLERGVDGADRPGSATPLVERVAKLADPRLEHRPRRRRGGTRALAPSLDVREEIRRSLLERLRRGCVLGEREQTMGIEPVRGRRSKRGGLHRVRRVREARANLVDDGARLFTGERRRLSGGDAEHVRTLVVVSVIGRR